MSDDNFKIPKISEETLKAYEGAQKILRNTNFNLLNTTTSLLKQYNSNMMSRPSSLEGIDEIHKKIAKQNQEGYQREIENNENLKNLVLFNQQLVDYNQQLVSLNEGILRKISIIGSTMDSIKENISESNQGGNQILEGQTELLLQLISIMESKDKKGNLGDFLKDLTGDVAAGLITGYLQYKLGLS